MARWESDNITATPPLPRHRWSRRNQGDHAALRPAIAGAVLLPDPGGDLGDGGPAEEAVVIAIDGLDLCLAAVQLAPAVGFRGMRRTECAADQRARPQVLAVWPSADLQPALRTPHNIS